MGKYGNGILVSDGNGNEVIQIGGNWYEKSVPAHLYRELAHVRGGDAGVGGRQHNGAVGLGETDAAAGQVVVHVVRDESAARSEPRVTRVQVELPFLHHITHATNFTFF